MYNLTWSRTCKPRNQLATKRLIHVANVLSFTTNNNKYQNKKGAINFMIWDEGISANLKIKSIQNECNDIAQPTRPLTCIIGQR